MCGRERARGSVGRRVGVMPLYLQYAWAYTVGVSEGWVGGWIYKHIYMCRPVISIQIRDVLE